MKFSKILKAIGIFALLLDFESSQAATLTDGVLTLNIDRDDLIAGVTLDRTLAPSIYVEEFFDASAASKTQFQILNDNTPIDLTDYAANEIPANNLQFAANGASIAPNPAGRQNRPTTFSFDPNNLFSSATGSVGLGGVIRFRVDVAPPSNRILSGDLTLDYNPALENVATGQSGWVLINHIGFDAGAFDLFDVTTNLTGNTLTLSGILGLGDGFDHLGGIPDARIGNFTFQATVVPVPAAAWLFVSGVTGLFVNGRFGRKSVP